MKNIKKITAMSFSPTHGTRRTTGLVAEEISGKMDISVSEVDITSPEKRQKEYLFSGDELLVMGMPVYAGRLPNKIAPDLEKMLHGDGTPAVVVVSYGNRSCGDGVTELQKILEKCGFRPLGAAAIATRHAFTDKIATNRPDEGDRKEIHEWCMKIADKLGTEEPDLLPSVLQRELAPYYVPLKEDGTPAVFLKAKPKTKEDLCDDCGVCARVCPMGSISPENCGDGTGICIKCQACVRSCHTGAKYFDDSQFLSHVAMLEKNFTTKAENTYLV